jgi:hypothetical protein
MPSPAASASPIETIDSCPPAVVEDDEEPPQAAASSVRARAPTTALDGRDRLGTSEE